MWSIVLFLGLTEALFYVAGNSFSSDEKLVPLVNISVVEGKPAELPCDITPPGEDTLHMVFWFKDEAGVPLYTIDAREKPVTKAQHFSDSGVFGPRAYFRTAFPRPAVLVIDDIKRHDAATYRCRVDFRKGQTRSFRYNLTVIVPPEQPTILDRWGRILNGTAGPYEEGDTPYLTCRVTGGKPEPMVRWLINGHIKDEEYENNAGDVIENRLTLQPITRSELGANFTCEAHNTDLVEPKLTSITLDINLKPLTVALRRHGKKDIGNESLLAGRHYGMECETTGSRPPAVITWYKGRRRQLKHTKEERSENRTLSLVEFEPGVEDHGKSITCRAENPNVTGLFLEKSWKIDVVYPPIVSLNLGSTLSPEDIKEGDDVYFECHIRANPSWSKLTWIHDNQILAHNTSARIIWSNQSLVLQSVTRSSAGRYVCAATNALNETRSEPLHFRVKFAPVCKDDRIIVVGASRGESLDIACRVEADPPAHNFRWKFNNSGETLEVAPGRFSMEKSSGVSVLKYTPSTELDYGTLSCWADNLVGTQARPCLFQLVAAGKPFPVRNCTLANQTYTSVEVKCVPGYDGGLTQKFVLEVYHGDIDFLSSIQPLYNVSNIEEPSFALSGLEASVEAGVHVAVYAVNAKGRSQPAILTEVTYRDAEKRTGQDAGIVLSPIIGVVVGTLVTLVLIILVVVIRVRRERISKPRHEKPAELSELPAQQYPMQNLQQTVETDPDVIPNKFEGNLVEVSPPSYPAGYPPGHWVTPGPTPSIDELCHKFSGRPTELRLPSRSTIPALPNMPMTGVGVMVGTGQGIVVGGGITGINTQGVVVGGGQGVVVAGECLDGEAIKRRLMANRLPESCV
ncbi:nephrin-like isoform X1 [Vespa velutina]|uniref:nephrin-like isoform X1 n=1 Tax=Vespa velutina TaxID=202808 RepID=UPI001FB20281|nr:nephrin-like isoform X1 [Vespa velutina]